MRGAVTAGMCVALERAGLLPAFDRVIGCSSGALAGCYAAAGQAERWARSFEDAACRAFIDPRRALRRRPVLDLDYLFEHGLPEPPPALRRRPRAGPELSTVAVTADTGELRVLVRAWPIRPRRSPRCGRAARSRSSRVGRPRSAASRSSTAGCSSRSRSARRCARARRTCSCCARGTRAGARSSAARSPSARSAARIRRSRRCSTPATPRYNADAETLADGDDPRRPPGRAARERAARRALQHRRAADRPQRGAGRRVHGAHARRRPGARTAPGAAPGSRRRPPVPVRRHAVITASMG